MDTTPAYPEPDAEQVQAAIRLIFPIFEYIAPGTLVTGPLLIRAMMFSGASTASAMWAIHRLVEQKVMWPRSLQSVPDSSALATEDDHPAGVKMIGGKIEVRGRNNNFFWPGLVLSVDHDRLWALRITLCGLCASH